MKGRVVWSAVSVPVVAPVGWSRAEIAEGLGELQRLRCRIDAAVSSLIAGIGTNGRDTAAAVCRATRSSGRAAREQVKVAGVVEKVPGAGDALAEGTVSAEHLVSLAKIGDASDAAALLPCAGVQSPEDFANTVAQFQLDRDTNGVRERQRAVRSVRFFNAEEGCFGMRAVLTPVEGAEFRARLDQIIDAAWKAEHPERAATRGGHGGPSTQQRRADALMSLIRGEAGFSSKPSIVVVVEEETLSATVAGTGPGSGPIPFDEAASLAARADVYAAVRSADRTILHFGRSRRLASAIQRLAVIVRDGGQCAFPGCDCSYERCVVHHTVDASQGGLTDIDVLALLCWAHHTYLHLNKLCLIRDGTRWKVVPQPTEWRDTG